MSNRAVYFGLSVGAILTAGLILNAAGSGQFGSQLEHIAKKVTEGYGI
jgi:hypothetical protein